MTDVLTSGETMGAFRAAGPFRLGRTAVAAFAVATPGDWQGLPTRTDLDLLDLQPGSTVR
jgi:2-dehydro-3-deoxygluconokinase